jgi:ArsR family transcriptional regulator
MSMPELALHIDTCQYAGMTATRRTPSCCSPVLQAPLGRRDAEELAVALRALADPVRLRLLSFIAAQPRAEACVCHLTGPVQLSQPTVSHHLKLLHDAGILGREKRGAWVFYRVLPERLEAIRATLATRGVAARAARRA